MVFTQTSLLNEENSPQNNFENSLECISRMLSFGSLFCFGEKVLIAHVGGEPLRGGRTQSHDSMICWYATTSINIIKLFIIKVAFFLCSAPSMETEKKHERSENKVLLINEFEFS